MEIFQTIWNALIMPNEELSTLLSIPLIFVEATVSMLLFTTILNIESTKQKKLLYVILVSLLGIISRLLIPAPYGTFINLAFMIITIKTIFDITIFKSIICIILPFIITVLLETILSKIYCFIPNISYEQGYIIPITRVIFMCLTYIFMLLLYALAKYFHFNITLLDNMNPKNKRLLIISSILGFISIGTQLYLTIFYSEILSLSITLLSIICLLCYFFISIYNLTKTTQLEIANQDIENLQLYNKTLTILHDNIRAFKHDFNNIVQAIGGYISIKDMDGLSNYYNDLLDDCQRVNNLTTLSPEVVNNPSIFSILASKYHLADEKGIKINLEVFLDLNTINMKIYEFTRILGILLDNSIEAAQECDTKIINVVFRKDLSINRQLVIIENTYANKDIDTMKIFEKAYSTKPNNSGLGLWEVNQILNKNSNLSLYTSKNDEYFRQQLEIYI